MPLAERAAFGWRLVAALASAEPAERASARIAERVRHREASFLERLERDFWPTEGVKNGAPYQQLLELGGWRPERVRAAVAERGLETTLAEMAADGVRLDAAEAKGRRALVRGGRELPFAPRDLDAVSGPAVPLSTSGSTGRRSTNPIDLAGLRLQASYMPAMLAGLGNGEQPLVLYYPAASAAGIAHLVSFTLAGKAPAAWFCHLDERRGALSPWRFWLLALRLAARSRGVVLPRPRLAEVERPRTLVDWLLRRAPAGAIVATFPGSALRIQSWARAQGVALPPLTFILGGEPVSALKRARLEADGHRVFPWYGAVDFGRVAVGCLRPDGADDMHLLTDRFAAVVEPDGESPTPGRGRLLLTSLVPEVHRRMLNLDTGDRVEWLRRRCGCPFDALGLDQHLRGVHSEEKLTLDGVTLDADRVHALASELLPAACGGSPADFQLVESEDDSGLTRLVVRVRPTLAVDPAEVARVVLATLDEAAGGANAMVERLRLGDVVRVLRESPRLTAGGKARAVVSEDAGAFGS